MAIDVSIKGLLKALDGGIIENLAKNEEDMTFSLRVENSIHDFTVRFSYSEQDQFMALIQDAYTSKQWKEVLRRRAPTNTDGDIYDSIERTLKLIPLDTLKDIVESNKNIHFSLGESRRTLRQIDIRGNRTGDTLKLYISIDKLFRGPLSLLNGMISDTRVTSIKDEVR